MKEFLTVLFFAAAQVLSAQHNIIESYKAKEIKHYTKFSELPLQKQLFAIESRDIIIFLAHDNKIWLAAMKAGQWTAFMLMDNFTKETELKVEEQQVDGTGNKELIIRWDYMGKVEFLNVIFKGIQIWNTDDAVCYLDEFTVLLEERYARESDLHFYAGCERKIEINFDTLIIETFKCDYDLGIEVLPENLYTGTFYFSEGNYRKNETGDMQK
jgi:hypothetical protein